MIPVKEFDLTEIRLNYALLCLLLAADSEVVATPIPIDGYDAVASSEQLWRYQVGGDGTEGLTPGDAYICLIDRHGNFIREDGAGAHGDGRTCGEDNRFEVVIEGGDPEKVKLKGRGDRFLRCSGSDVITSTARGGATDFVLYVDAERQEKLYLYNADHNSLVSAPKSGKKLSFEATELDKDDALSNATDSVFSGWKKGSKDFWTATDKWVVAGIFENKHPEQPARITYGKTIGVAQSTPSPDVVDLQPKPGAGFGDFFKKMVSTKINVQWQDEPGKAWSEEDTEEGTTEVPAGTTRILYQAVGTYGIFSVKSEQFRTQDIDSSGNIVTERLSLKAT